ncbi:RNA polymerase sigma factor [Gemmata sp. JC673]|uniref:RNA polymerase sigma factor n=1 Tax=Gemmata algarum TaxID=2975278 RepID=A0ABU5F3F0_9BACT|nr:RNA polymerase sigma factor [Gemmata algarum]MDY3560399.1 RNA polymerase sigma factor [Gemmata algarum]
MSKRLLFRLLASAPPGTDHVTDAELLRRFAASADSAAFELIVHRHAPAVWAACRRLLAADADAEDAFQAAFLALLRCARDVRTPCVGGWLHRVAVHAALKLRERTRRVTAVEPQQFDATPAAPVEPADSELVAVVHEELARLPERERLPVVLCDLEGLSHADAAKALGWPVGTVSGRLSRARATLRARLGRRGFAPAAFGPVGMAPPHLVTRTLPMTAGQVPAAVASLTEGVLAVLNTTHWVRAVAAAVVVCSGIAGAGSMLAVAPSGTSQPQKAEAVPPPRAPGTPAPKSEITQPASPKNIESGWRPALVPQTSMTAFPEVAALDWAKPSGIKEAFKQQCPRLTGVIELKADPADDTLRKLLKARLQAGISEHIRIVAAWEVAGPYEQSLIEFHGWLADMQAIVTELWGRQPKEQELWLTELLIAAKASERHTELRVRAGAYRPQLLDVANRHRLKVETELWKVKNPK